jgi:hypothetical protein
LSGSGNSASTAFSLTAEGTADWVHWGDSSLNRKNGVGAQIGNYTVYGSGQVLGYSNDLRTLSWTDGAPTAGDSNNNGIYINSLGNGFSFTVPADTNTRSLQVHVGGYYSGGTMTAHLSDVSAPDYVDSTAEFDGQYDRNYSLSFNAAAAGQTLTITWATSSGGGNVTLNGAALSLSRFLSGTGSSLSTAVNLTTEGTVDWVHWGDSSLNRKNGVSAQIGNYTVVGSGPAIAYSDDLRTVTWSDGSPTLNGSNTNGLYINSPGNGFSFTVPADNNPRRVTVHAGGYHSGGTLTAHLSDGSAPDYVDSTAGVSGQYDRTYTLTYSSVSAGQTLTVSWVTSASDGNVSLSGAALSFASPTVSAGAGTPQSTVINTAFGVALQATVRDYANNPVTGILVTFTAPVTGISGKFGGSATATAYTNSHGVATAPAFTANGQTGLYSVTASVAGPAAPANFSLTNDAVPVTGGSLSGSGTSSSSGVNLTAEGTADWVHWGAGSTVRKAAVSPQISDYTVVGSGTVQSYGDDPRALSWTDGTPNGTGTDNDGVYIYFPTNGFSFTATADTTARILMVHVGGYLSGGTLTAHLSDGSATDYVDTTGTAGGQYDRNYTLNYKAASAGQNLTVSWVASSGTANVTLNGAALVQNGGGGSPVSQVREYIRLGTRVVAIESNAAAVPTFSPAGGSYASAQMVTISDAAPHIMFTLDGSTPSESHGTLYSGAITVSTTTTIKAVAYGGGVTDSAVSFATYTITAGVATPVISPAGGVYTGTQTISITSATSGASIQYTTDGSTPTHTHGMPYAGSFALNTSETVKAIAYESGMADSGVASAQYVFVSVTIIAPSQPISAATGDTRQFYAIVNGSSPQGITWTATYGTITTAGLYTAPSSVPSGGTDTVTAASVAYPAATASVQVAVSNTLVTVTPFYQSGVYLVAGGAGQQFTAAVTPNVNPAVTWVVGPAGVPNGTISSGGYYTPPPASPQLNSTIANLVTATSVADTTANGTSFTEIDPVPTPRVMTMSPINSTGTSVTFSIQVTGGEAPFEYMDLFLSTSLEENVPGAGCLIQMYNPAYNDSDPSVGDDTYSWTGSNYCTAPSSTFTPSGNGGTMQVTVTFMNWSGTTQNVYATVANANSGVDPAGYQQMGQWRIP